MHRFDLSGVRAKAKKLSPLGVLALAGDVIIRLLEDRTSSWANHKIDEDIGPVVNVTAHALKFIAEHPLQTALDIVGLYCVAVVGWAFIHAYFETHPLRPTVSIRAEGGVAISAPQLSGDGIVHDPAQIYGRRCDGFFDARRVDLSK